MEGACMAPFLALMADPGLQSLSREFGARAVPGSLQVD